MSFVRNVYVRGKENLIDLEYYTYMKIKKFLKEIGG